MTQEDLSLWSGNIEEFVQKSAEIAARGGLTDEGGANTRLIRDYLHRGILGTTERSGREIVFGYNNLLRFLAARVLLRDKWPLEMISQHFATSPQADLEALVPWLSNRAIEVLTQIKRESTNASDGRDPQLNLRRHVARISGIQSEMREAMQRLGLPTNAVATEEVTLIALAPWCQVLVQKDRLKHITVEEAEDIGRSLTASLLDIATRKVGRK